MSLFETVVGVVDVVGPPAATRVTWGNVAERPGDLDGQWAVLESTSDGGITLTTSSTLTSGMFWCFDRGRLLVAARLGELVQSRRDRTRFNHAWLRDHLLGSTSAHQTPYEEVHRIPPATQVVWAPGRREPQERSLIDLSAWPPRREGPDVVAQYLSTFDAAVDALVPEGRALCATLSGGLDSSFVVASLVRHASPDRPVHAFCHRPHPQAELRSRGHWDPDEYDVATLMAKYYGDRIRLVPLVNDDLRQPLQVCADLASDTWYPMINVDNVPWMEQALARTSALGSDVLFLGENGNASFSYEHGYAARYFLRTGRLADMAALLSAERQRGTPWWPALKRQWVAPLTAPVRHRTQVASPAWLIPALNLPRVSWTRERYLRWLRADGSVRAMSQPAADGTRVADPFTAASVMELAASISPVEWVRGPASRGFARRAGLGRVPDGLRLRTRRGGQSWDAWFTVRDQKQRYLDEVAALRTTPVMCDVIDVDYLQAHVAAWPWGRPGPTPRALYAVNKLLHLGDFTRMTVGRLAALPPREP